MSRYPIGVITLFFAVLPAIQGCDKQQPTPAPAPITPPPQAAPTTPAPVPPPVAAPAPQAATPTPEAAASAQPQTSGAASAPQPAAPVAQGMPPPSAPAQPPVATPAPQAAAAAPATLPAPPAAPVKAALATSDGEKPGSRIEVQELKRVSGGTVMLRFIMINDADQTLTAGYSFGEGGAHDYATVGGVHFIDPVGKKKYLVVRDSQHLCDCSRSIKDIGAKSRVSLWARFPAPPENVEKIVIVVPHFAPMDDVPISR